MTPLHFNPVVTAPFEYEHEKQLTRGQYVASSFE